MNNEELCKKYKNAETWEERTVLALLSADREIHKGMPESRVRAVNYCRKIIRDNPDPDTREYAGEILYGAGR